MKALAVGVKRVISTKNNIWGYFQPFLRNFGRISSGSRTDGQFSHIVNISRCNLHNNIIYVC